MHGVISTMDAKRTIRRAAARSGMGLRRRRHRPASRLLVAGRELPTAQARAQRIDGSSLTELIGGLVPARGA